MSFRDLDPREEVNSFSLQVEILDEYPDHSFVPKLASFISNGGIVTMPFDCEEMSRYFTCRNVNGARRKQRGRVYIRKEDGLNKIIPESDVALKKRFEPVYDSKNSSLIRHRIASLSPYTTNMIGVLSNTEFWNEKITGKPLKWREKEFEACILQFRHKLWLLNLGYIDLDISPVNCATVNGKLKIFDKGNVFHKFSLIGTNKERFIKIYLTLHQRLTFTTKKLLSDLEKILTNGDFEGLRMYYNERLIELEEKCNS